MAAFRTEDGVCVCGELLQEVGGDLFIAIVCIVLEDRDELIDGFFFVGFQYRQDLVLVDEMAPCVCRDECVKGFFLDALVLAKYT